MSKIWVESKPHIYSVTKSTDQWLSMCRGSQYVNISLLCMLNNFQCLGSYLRICIFLEKSDSWRKLGNTAQLLSVRTCFFSQHSSIVRLLYNVIFQNYRLFKFYQKLSSSVGEKNTGDILPELILKTTNISIE